MLGHEVFAAQVGHDLENKTRAQLLDLLELALPADKFALVKRNVDTILRSCVERAKHLSLAVERNNGYVLAHWFKHSGNDGYTCGCGAFFHVEVGSPEQTAEERYEANQKAHDAISAHIAQFK